MDAMLESAGVAVRALAAGEAAELVPWLDATAARRISMSPTTATQTHTG